MLKNGSVLYFDPVIFVMFKPWWELFVTRDSDWKSKKLDRTNFVCLLFGFAIEVFVFYKHMHSKMLTCTSCIVRIAY